MPQRRQHRRYPVRQHVWCMDGASTFFVRASDASLGGLYLRAPGIPVGRVLHLSFVPPEGDEIRIATRAVWSGRATRGRLGVGLEILDFAGGEDAYEHFVRAAATG